MRSSQEIAETPLSANFFVQNVFPAPDMPMSARRRGFSLFVSAVISEAAYDSLNAAPRQQARHAKAGTKSDANLEPVLQDGLRPLRASVTFEKTFAASSGASRWYWGAPEDFFAAQFRGNFQRTF
jgi:hypothetical protein